MLPSVGLAVLAVAPGIFGSVLPNVHRRQSNESSTASPVTAVIQQGQVEGAVVGGVRTWLGIPYAAPPTGDLRWRPPSAPASFNRTFQAKMFGNACIQPPERSNITLSEDCLYLNVYSPIDADANSKLPVALYIHGGGFGGGQSSDFNMTNNVLEGNIVYVTINYRLGALGFLSLPGLNSENVTNFGLADQQAALKWAQSNIAAFGGDPEKVTVSGESAGGASVCYHLIAPESKGLYSQAIIQSFSCSSGKLFGTNDANVAAILNATSCSDAACLRNADAETITNYTKAGSQVTITRDSILPFDSIAQQFFLSNFSDVPLIHGNNANEDGIQWYFTPQAYWPRSGSIDSYFNRTFGVYSAAARNTWPNATTTENPLDAQTIVDSSLSACDCINSASLISQKSPVYLYEFADATAPYAAFNGSDQLPWTPKSYHSSELPYLYDAFLLQEYLPAKLTADQQSLGKSMRAYFNSFIKTGSPSSNTSDLSSWTQYQNDGIAHGFDIPSGGGIGPRNTNTIHHCDFLKSSGFTAVPAQYANPGFL